LKGVIEYWIAQGVRVFRVDNPHTKSLPFWEWALGEIRGKRPDTIFLAEAFTRPRVMYGLAKMGFNQSYNYFPWRNTKAELTEYLTELTRTPVREYFRANLWPNTPDILPYFLQHGGRAPFMIRLILAATLGSSYGIYGPAFELLESAPHTAGAEEYLNSEKYEIRDWDLNQPGNLTDLITRVNRIRRENPALQEMERLDFHYLENERLLVYSKTTEDLSNAILVVVNLDPDHAQSGWVGLALEKLGVRGESFEVHDLLTDARYTWRGSWNYVELRPWEMPAHIFRVTPS
jgi:starch synthase (maltosyl-transferring)